MVAMSRAMTQPSLVAQSMRFASALASSESHSALNRSGSPLRRMCLGPCPSNRFMRAFSPAREIEGEPMEKAMERIQAGFAWASVAAFAAWSLFTDAGKARELLQLAQLCLLGASAGSWAFRRRVRKAGGVTDVH